MAGTLFFTVSANSDQLGPGEIKEIRISFLYKAKNTWVYRPNGFGGRFGGFLATEVRILRRARLGPVPDTLISCSGIFRKMTTLECVIAGTYPLSRYALWPNIRHAQRPEAPGGLLEPPPPHRAEYSRFHQC